MALQGKKKQLFVISSLRWCCVHCGIQACLSFHDGTSASIKRVWIMKVVPMLKNYWELLVCYAQLRTLAGTLEKLQRLILRPETLWCMLIEGGVLRARGVV